MTMGVKGLTVLTNYVTQGDLVLKETVCCIGGEVKH